MKASKLFIAFMSCVLWIGIATAQSSVLAISNVYSNETVAKMILKYQTSPARDVTPPAELTAKFKADFSKASDVEWETADNIYEVEFDVQFKDWKAYYDAKGNLLMTVEEIYRSELPVAVKNSAEAKYPEYAFEDIDKIRRGTEVFYKIEMELRDTEVELMLQSNGTIVKEKIDY
jgi:hypothetical protein